MFDAVTDERVNYHAGHHKLPFGRSDGWPVWWTLAILAELATGVAVPDLHDGVGASPTRS